MKKKRPPSFRTGEIFFSPSFIPSPPQKKKSALDFAQSGILRVAQPIIFPLTSAASLPSSLVFVTPELISFSSFTVSVICLSIIEQIVFL